MNYGIEFEKRLLANVPPGAGSQKMNTPVPPPRPRKGAPSDQEGEGGDARHTPRQPYDLQLWAPLRGSVVAGPFGTPLWGLVKWTVEVKSVKGRRFAHNAIRKNQLKGLRKAAGEWCQSGLLLEFRNDDESTELIVYVPIGAYLSAVAGTEMKSLTARELLDVGMRVEHGAGGLIDLARFMRAFGAAV